MTRIRMTNYGVVWTAPPPAGRRGRGRGSRPLGRAVSASPWESSSTSYGIDDAYSGVPATGGNYAKAVAVCMHGRDCQKLCPSFRVTGDAKRSTEARRGVQGRPRTRRGGRKGPPRSALRSMLFNLSPREPEARQVATAIILTGKVTSARQDISYSYGSGMIETSDTPHAAHSKRRTFPIAEKEVEGLSSQRIEANGRGIPAHGIGASHIEADEALRLDVGDRERLVTHVMACWLIAQSGVCTQGSSQPRRRCRFMQAQRFSMGSSSRCGSPT